MKTFHTVVLERLTRVDDWLETEPYEVGWSDEAILFFQLQNLQPGTEVVAVVYISVDGINWIEEGTRSETITQDGHYFVRITHFGGWLRAAFEVSGNDRPVTLTTQLALKG